MKRLVGLVGLVAVLVLVAACESSRSLTDSGSTESTSPTTFTGTDTTTSSTTTNPTATSAASTTTTIPAECVPVGDDEPKSSDDPLLMSSMVGLDIRAGAHPCFERVVIELQGEGDFPGWTVEFVEDPVRIGESDDLVEIAGAATLQVTMRAWMPSLEGGGYVGPIQFVPEHVFHILEMRKTENHEGMCIWSIGLDAEYAFTVEVLHAPERLVIDIQIPPAG